MQFYFLAPYYNNASEQLILNFTNRLSTIDPQTSFLAVNKNYLTLGNFFKFKDDLHACGLQLFTSFLVETVMPSTWARSRDLRFKFTSIWVRQKGQALH